MTKYFVCFVICCLEVKRQKINKKESITKNLNRWLKKLIFRLTVICVLYTRETEAHLGYQGHQVHLDSDFMDQRLVCTKKGSLSIPVAVN